MDTPREPIWAEHEKIYLLGEIVKAGALNSTDLLDIIHKRGISPKWTEIALPHGRSLSSCQKAYADLLYRPRENMQQQQQPPMSSPMQYRAPDLARKRTHSGDTGIPTGRLLQPRPPVPYPEMIPGPTYHIATVGEPAHKKKRGRPTKAEVQARTEEAAARGEVYQPQSRRKPRPSTPAGEPSAATPPQPQSTTPAFAVGATSTPRATQADLEEEESSGKRRRARPMPLEVGGTQLQEEGGPVDTPSRPDSTATAGNGRSTQERPSSASEGPLSAPLERRDRDVRMEGAEEPTPTPQHPPPPQSITPRSFKETVGM